jgi:hypothetical protein
MLTHTRWLVGWPTGLIVDTGLEGEGEEEEEEEENSGDSAQDGSDGSDEGTQANPSAPTLPLSSNVLVSLATMKASKRGLPMHDGSGIGGKRVAKGVAVSLYNGFALGRLRWRTAKSKCAWRPWPFSAKPGENGPCHHR